MDKAANQQDNLTKVSQALLAAWKINHGTVDGQAQVMQGADNVAVLIDKAFAPAERSLAAEDRGCDLLNQYSRRILEFIAAEQSPVVEQATGRSVITTRISTDAAEGWVICVFQLAAAA